MWSMREEAKLSSSGGKMLIWHSRAHYSSPLGCSRRETRSAKMLA